LNASRKKFGYHRRVKVNKSVLIKLAVLLTIYLGCFPGNLSAQTGGVLYVWAGWNSGGVDTLRVNPGRWVDVPIYMAGDTDVWLADMNYPLGLNVDYFDSFDSVECQAFYPFSEWDIHDFANFNDENGTGPAGPTPPGWISLSFFGIARVADITDPYFHSEIPLHVFNFRVHTVNNPNLVGNTVLNAIGPGYDRIQGPANAGDTLGGPGYEIVQSFSPVIFEGGGYILGMVTDSVGFGIENVFVYLADSSRTDSTDSQGNYILRNIPPGDYTVSFSHPGYYDTSVADVNVTFYDTTRVDAVMRYKGYGALSGVVYDSLETPLEGAEVSLMNNAIYGITDSEGGYILENVPVDIYSVRFSHPLYRDTTINNVNILRDETTSLDIVLIYRRVDDDAKPDRIRFLRNYPNPFNSATMLEFYLTEAAAVTVDIYDILGRKVKRVTSMQGNAGYNSVAWDGTNYSGREVASGVYYFKVSDDNAGKSKAMTVVK
jgi:hypothetical protein